MTELLVYAAIFFIAAFTHGAVGLGFPMTATPLLALFTDIQTAIILTLLPNLLVNVVSIASESNFVQAIKQHWKLALLAMLGSGVGTLVLLYVDSKFFEVLLALAIVVYLLASRLQLKMAWVAAKPRAAKLVFGLSAGLLGGLTNVMAPVLIIYALEAKFSRKELIQASNICFLLGKLIQLILFSWYGQITASHVSVSLLALLLVSVALSIGIAIRNRLSTETYTRVLRGVLWCLAFTMITKAILW